MEEIESVKLGNQRIVIRSVHGNDDQLCKSLIKNGLLQPILIRPVGDYFEIIAGNRRYSACRHLGWRKMLCHVIELNDKEANEVSIVENIRERIYR